MSGTRPRRSTARPVTTSSQGENPIEGSRIENTLSQRSVSRTVESRKFRVEKAPRATIDRYLIGSQKGSFSTYSFKNN